MVDYRYRWGDRGEGRNSRPRVTGGHARWALAATTLLLSVALSAAAGQEDSLAEGSGSSLTTLLEKTILRVDVLTLKLRVDRATQQKLLQLTRGRTYSEPLAEQIAKVALQMANAEARITFLRSVSLARFTAGVIENLKRARKAAIITDHNYRVVSEGLPRWFGMLRARGFQKGDQLLYRITPAGLRTRLRTANGRMLLDQSDPGRDPILALLGGYFAPSSDFRKGLIRSLFP